VSAPAETTAVHVPATVSRRPLVVVHGTRSKPSALLGAFTAPADALGMPILAPWFGRLSGYQRLGTPAEPLSAIDVLHDAVDKLGAELGGKVDSFDLLGFSGGAQFAHRYALVHPERVGRMVLGAAGWYTYLDDRPFPGGVGPSEVLGGFSIDIGAFLRIPTLILVGERDVQRNASLRTGRRLDARQGEHRLARAITWRAHLGSVAARLEMADNTQVAVMRATGHSLRRALERGGLVERSMAFITGAE